MIIVNKDNFCLGCYKYKDLHYWCIECNVKQLQQEFSNWTSRNEFVDKFIQEIQLNDQNKHQILEWISYNSFINIKYLDKGGFSTVYEATWLDGPIEKWSYEKKKMD